MQKDVAFLGSTLDDLRRLPQGIRRAAGYQLNKLQENELPDDWKPMPGIGAGVSEIRIRDATGAYRIMYTWRSSWRQSMYCTYSERKLRRLPLATWS